MRNIYLIIGSLLYTLSSSSVLALEGDDYAKYFAARFASMISSAKNSDELGTMPLKPKDREIRKAKIAQISGEFIIPQVVLRDALDVSLRFKDLTVMVSFKKFSNRTILIQGEPVQLQPFKTYLNYYAEIETILGSKKKKSAFFSYLMTEAVAQTMAPLPTIIDNLTSTVTYISNSVNYGTQDETTIALARAYRADLEMFQTYYDCQLPKRAKCKETGSPMFPTCFCDSSYAPAIFKCEKGKLESMSVYVADTRQYRTPIMVSTGKGTYKVPQGDREIILDSNFRVISDNLKYREFRLKKGNFYFGTSDNEFRDALPQAWLERKTGGYDGFPELAKKCCETSGCFEAVSKDFQKNVETAKKVQTRGSRPSDR